jgi:23S rRNA-/tRNA-specific pseudouridylate synthase
MSSHAQDEGKGNHHRHHNNKRGMKPRSQQRASKRARVDDRPLVDYQVSIRPLALNNNDETTVVHPLTYIRTIEPYPYTFSTFCKARWIGRSVLDVYCSEFGSYPKSYYESAIRQGRIQVSSKQVDLEYKLKGQDKLTHTVHRHEPSVVVSDTPSDGQPPIIIVAETDDLVVVDKPGTLPVHPCGAYQHNSLLPIMEASHGRLHVIHRIDRLTSGLMLLAKNSKVAQTWGKALMERSTCNKVYVARVKGKFPTKCPTALKRRMDEGEPVVVVQYGVKTSNTTSKDDLDVVVPPRQANALGFWISNKEGALDTTSSVDDVFESQLSIDQWLSDDDDDKVNNKKEALWFHLACPTRIANHKDGVCEAGGFDDLSDELYKKSVKPAQTSFGVVRYDAATDSTIVMCRPQTGRTHQIRLHLQYLGHAIANDPCYGGELWYGDTKGKMACQEAAAILAKLNANANAAGAGAAGSEVATSEVATTSDIPEAEKAAGNEVATIKAEQVTGSEVATISETPKAEKVVGNEMVTIKTEQVTGSEVATISDTPKAEKAAEVATISDTPASEAEIARLANLTRDPSEPLEEFYKKTCVWCARSGGTDRSMLELLVRSRGIWLHALKYRMMDANGTELNYRTGVPNWS